MYRGGTDKKKNDDSGKGKEFSNPVRPVSLMPSMSPSAVTIRDGYTNWCPSPVPIGDGYTNIQSRFIRPDRAESSPPLYLEWTEKSRPKSSAARRTTYPLGYQNADVWKINAKDVQLVAELGEGHFGTCYLAKWLQQKVVIKMRKKQNDGTLENFQCELEMCMRLRHPQICQFLGACTEQNEEFICLEYLRGGSLHKLLHGTQRRVTMMQRVQILLDVAYGLNYLHTRSPPIAHCDLTTANVLLDDHMKAKLADFGLSQHVDKKHRDAGNVYYMAPEVLAGTREFSVEMDIYSFAIVAWETFTRKEPQVVCGTSNLATLTHRVNNERFRPPLNISQWDSQCPSPDLQDLISSCWVHVPTSRPSAGDVIKTLRSEKKRLRQAAPTSVMFSCQHGFLHELTLRLNRMTWSINGVVKVDRVNTLKYLVDADTIYHPAGSETLWANVSKPRNGTAARQALLVNIVSMSRIANVKLFGFPTTDYLTLAALSPRPQIDIVSAVNNVRMNMTAGKKDIHTLGHRVARPHLGNDIKNYRPRQMPSYARKDTHKDSNNRVDNGRDGTSRPGAVNGPEPKHWGRSKNPARQLRNKKAIMMHSRPDNMVAMKNELASGNDQHGRDGTNDGNSIRPRRVNVSARLGFDIPRSTVDIKVGRVGSGSHGSRRHEIRRGGPGNRVSAQTRRAKMRHLTEELKFARRRFLKQRRPRSLRRRRISRVARKKRILGASRPNAAQKIGLPPKPNLQLTRSFSSDLGDVVIMKDFYMMQEMIDTVAGPNPRYTVKKTSGISSRPQKHSINADMADAQKKISDDSDVDMLKGDAQEEILHDAPRRRSFSLNGDVVVYKADTQEKISDNSDVDVLTRDAQEKNSHETPRRRSFSLNGDVVVYKADTPLSDSYGSLTNEFETEVDGEILLESRPGRQPLVDNLEGVSTKTEAVIASASTHPTGVQPAPKITNATKIITGSQKRFATPNFTSEVTGMRRALALARLARRRKVRRQSGHSPRGSPSRPADRTNIKQDDPKASNYDVVECIFCGPRAQKMKNLGEAHASGQPGESASLVKRTWPATPRTPDTVSVIIADEEASSTAKNKASVFTSASQDSSTKKAKAVTHVFFNKNCQNITGPDSLIGTQCAKCRLWVPARPGAKANGGRQKCKNCGFMVKIPQDVFSGSSLKHPALTRTRSISRSDSGLSFTSSSVSSSPMFSDHSLGGSDGSNSDH